MTTFELKKTNKGLHISLWIAQVLLAVMFIMAGFMKVTASVEELSANVSWAGDLPWFIRFISTRII